MSVPGPSTIEGPIGKPSTVAPGMLTCRTPVRARASARRGQLGLREAERQPGAEEVREEARRSRRLLTAPHQFQGHTEDVPPYTKQSMETRAHFQKQLGTGSVNARRTYPLTVLAVLLPENDR
jgi:hypothetical protein